MIVGLISDTHDNLPKIEKAIKFFNKKKVGFVLHAGDFVAPFVIKHLNKLSCQWRGVFGNNDGEKEGLLRASKARIKEGPLRIKLAGENIVLVHNISQINPQKIKARVIVYGHTHKADLVNKDNKLIVNPGECSGWLSGKATIALLDLDLLSAKIFKI